MTKFDEIFKKKCEIHIEEFSKILLNKEQNTIDDECQRLTSLLEEIELDLKYYTDILTPQQKNNCSANFEEKKVLICNIKDRINLLEVKMNQQEAEWRRKHYPELYENEDYDFEDLKKEIIEYLNLKPVKVNTNSYKNSSSKLSDFFYNLKDKETFLKDLKKTFTEGKGKVIRALIECLKDEDVLNIGNRKMSKFIELLRKYFDRDIGTYSGINDPKYDDYESYKKEVNLKIAPLILKHKQRVQN